MLMRGNFASARSAFSAQGIAVTLVLLWILVGTQPGQASAAWKLAEVPAVAPTNRWVNPEKSLTYELDAPSLRAQLPPAPQEFAPASQTPVVISLPMPDGSFARFRVSESPVMAAELAAKFPEIKTYAGQGLDDASATVRFDVTPAGVHAQILSPQGASYIDPEGRGGARRHVAYFKRDYRREAGDFRCFTQEAAGVFQPAAAITPAASGATLRTYRLAVAATGEYTQFHGGTVAAGLAAIVTAVNRVNGIFESELAIRLVLVANNDRLVFTNAATDPYSNNDLNAMLTQNQATIDSVIGGTNYDVGHVFCTADGGLTGLAGAACFDGVKARSVTGLPAPTGDPFYIDYVAHELGHQFGALHSFNGTGGICNGQRSEAQAFEPGSGSTLMSYAGICDADDLQAHSDPYFHSASYDAIQFYVTVGFGKDCPVSTPTGNNPPVVSVGSVTNFNIPKGTPFTLTAFGSDPDGDALTYCWEERDRGPAQVLSSADNGSSPLFRSYAPTTNASRTFPNLANLLNNTTNLGEKLPTTSRTNKFRVTARDNRAGGGGVNAANMLVTVSASAGPFVVTSPNTSVNWSGTRLVTWNVAGTTASPINAATVDILLSTNGGWDFPIVLAAATPNDGFHYVILPNLGTTQARIKIQATGNIFFDVSDMNFTITRQNPLSFALPQELALLSGGCPGEMFTVEFAVINSGPAPLGPVVATLLATNGVIPLVGPQNLGLIPTGGMPVGATFNLLATGPCGGSVQAVWRLEDGTNPPVHIAHTLALGTLIGSQPSYPSPASITIPARNEASPYPSVISVSGVTGVIASLRVAINNLGHANPDDLDILLVGPGGQAVLLMSDCGGSADLRGVTLVFDDAATNSLPDNAQIVSGEYRPSNFGGGDTFSAPAPAGPYVTNLSVFAGASPNGAWSLYVMDDANNNAGGITNGWRLELTMQPVLECCTNATPPSLSMADASVVEGNFGTTNAQFIVTLSRPVGQSVSVNYTTASGSALASLDFVTTNGLLQFSPGQTNRSIAVAVLGDLLFEGNENFNMLLSNPVNAILSRSNAVGTIVDDEIRVAVSTGAGAQLQFNSVAGRTYRVEWTQDLPATNGWSILPGAASLPGSGGLLQITDTNAPTQPQRFYRIRDLNSN